jgi:hypothetical protein
MSYIDQFTYRYTVWQETPPIAHVTGCAPAVIPAGTVAFTWYKSANLGARPLNVTVAGWPPMVIMGVATVVDEASATGEPSGG